jgi:hypothetical protein
MADEWHQPIRMSCMGSGDSKLLTQDNRVVFLDAATDSAIVLVPNILGLPQDSIPLVPA